MTEKEFKKLKRRELLELMYETLKQLEETKAENERLRGELEQMKSSLLSRTHDMVARLCEDRFGELPGSDTAAGQPAEDDEK
ncbi:MAG: hypothetical protein IKP47_02245 [Ruminococcus sp.]|nr:hypothetical protein [Ruminococcus sp.]